MKRSLKLSLILILVVPLFLSIPSGFADYESLWCNSFDSTYMAWTETGASPYLHDTDADLVKTKTDGFIEGNFGFSDSSNSGTITSVTLYVEGEGDGDDYIEVYVSDGGSFTNEGNIVCDATYSFKTLDLSTKLDTWTKINAAEIYIIYRKGGSKNNFLIIRRAYLYIDHTPVAGENYYVYPTQALLFTGEGYRLCSFNRGGSQALSVTSDSDRIWSTSRFPSQSMILTTASNRILSLLITATQGITLTSSAIGQVIKLLQITVSQSILFTLDSERRFEAIRALGQSLILTSSSDRLWNLMRTAGQNLNFVSNAFGELVFIGEEFYRTVTISLSFTSNAFGQILAVGQEYFRSVNLALTLLGDIAVTQNIINEMNIELAVLFAGTIFWTLLFMRKNFESIPNGLLTWMFSWGTGYYWLASGATLPSVAWLFIIWGIVALYKTILSFLEYRKFLASR